MMHFFFEYLLKVSFVLALMFLFYQSVLRKLTFYNWNRWYLLGYSVLAFLIPFMNVTDFLFRHELQQLPVVQMMPFFPAAHTLTITENYSKEWTMQDMVWIVFTAGVLLMIIRMIVQFVSLYRLHTKATLLHQDGMKLFHVEAEIIPFSFHNAIYINRNLHHDHELKEIIKHEFVHIKQKHSIDILIGELLCIVLWFNPFAWLMRRAMRQNLEFIADHNVLQNGMDKKQYQYLLLKVMGNQQFSVTANFNFSSLKNRIAMMNKIKSARVQLIRFLFVLPLLAVLLLAFREKINIPLHANENDQTVTITESGTRKGIVKQQTGLHYWKQDSVPCHQFPANIRQVEIKKGNGEDKVIIKLKNGNVEIFDLKDPNQKELFERKYGNALLPPPPPAPPALRTMPDNVKSMNVIKKNGVNRVEMGLKNGTKESYDLNDPKQKAAFEKKYGKIDDAPSPPVLAEVPVGDPSLVEVPFPQSPASIAIAPAPPSFATVMEVPVAPVQPAVLNSKGYYLSVADDAGECIVIVKDKSKKIVEAVKFTEWNANEEKYEKKYGKVQPPPPPPPAPASVTIDGAASSTTNPEGIRLNGSVIQSAPGKSPLYVADGLVVETDVISNNTIKTEDIERINVLKGNGATTLYDAKGVNGVIEIKTKNTVTTGTVAPTFSITKKASGGWPSGALYMINGKEVSEKEAKELNPDLISSINVIKGESATKAYGKRGRNGVISILTKTKAATNKTDVKDNISLEPQ